jgi:hypothetical protein
MSSNVLPVVVLDLTWLTVTRTVLVPAQMLPPTCLHWGRRLERRYLGEQICGCARA